MQITLNQNTFWEQLKKKVFKKIEESPEDFNVIEIYSILISYFVCTDKNDIFYDATETKELLKSTNINEWCKNSVEKLIEQISCFQQRDSGGGLSQIQSSDIFIAKTNPMRDSSCLCRK